MRSSLLLLMAVAAAPATGADFTGRYHGQSEDGEVVLTLQQAGDRVTGSLLQDGETARVSGRATGAHLVATAESQGQALPFTADLAGDSLRVSAGDTAMTLSRLRGGPKPGVGSPRAAGASGQGRAERAPSGPRVVVNGVELDAARLEDLQRRHGLRFAGGDFWYDGRTGAWGVAGGPTAGFVAPGLPMGGPLRRDASRGNTNVLVNGRELRAEEVLALQSIGQPVFPGSYWIDAQGNYGIEGGPPVGNLYAAAQARRASREGILSTWDRTGVAVIGGR